MNVVYNMPCTELLPHLEPGKIQMIFADPPDNLGLGYEGFNDKLPDHIYYSWVESWLLAALRVAPIVWISYYWQHDIELKYLIRNILKFRHPAYKAKSFLWRYTFGQHTDTDCGSGFRYLVRLMRVGTPLYAHDIRVQSERQRMGDKRANPDGRVPDDVWDFAQDEIWDIPRVTGNSGERKAWHPTQHPERLIERVIRLCTKEGDQIADIFGGTGTTLRVAKRLNRGCLISEISPIYAAKIAEENFVSLYKEPPRL